MKMQHAQNRFGATYPELYQKLMDCRYNKGTFEATVRCVDKTSPIHRMGIKGRCMFQEDRYEDHYLDYVLDVDDAWFSYKSDPNLERHDCFYPVCLWDENGDLNTKELDEKWAGFPYQTFFSSGQADGYEFVDHPSLKLCGERIYDAIKKMFKTNSKRGNRLTEKQTLIEISETISTITGDDRVRDFFQDASDWGFSSDEDGYDSP
jgi:hypothetical protein